MDYLILSEPFGISVRTALNICSYMHITEVYNETLVKTLVTVVGRLSNFTSHVTNSRLGLGLVLGADAIHL